MKLNGWQRLWVALTVLWMLPNVFFAYSNWTILASVSKSDIYMKLKREDGERLTDYFDVIMTQLGGTNVDDQRVSELRKDKAFQAASLNDQKAYLTATDPHFAKASIVNQNAYLGIVTGRTGPIVDIDGQTVTFVQDLPQSDMDRTARAYDDTLKTILRHKRIEVLSRSIALWIGPSVGLYALGFAVVWVKRGFTTK
jgi:hypothetical protein